MALGIVFLSLKKGYTADAFSYLFGSILSVQSSDLWFTGGTVVLALLSWPLWSRWAYATFDRELAVSDRLKVTRDDYILSILIAVTVVVAVKVIGIVLIASFLVIPPATARLLSKTFFKMTILSVIIGITTAIIGLILSDTLDIPSGACIILVQALCFIVGLIIQSIRG
jgi:zinc transport system permease protein